VIEGVGPVLETNDVGRAIIAAIRETHAGIEVHDRGAYLRVLVPGGCAVTRVAIERALGRPFTLPADLELVMPSFKGTISITDDEVAWR
jgi:MmoB/DmpM family